MNNLIGRKCKGFKFEGEYYYDMDEHIGEVGKITYIDDLFARIRFKNHSWNYPLNEIENHLVPEEIEIPELGEGVLMEVSDYEDFSKSVRRIVIGKFNNSFIVCESSFSRIFRYEYARPIKTTLTKQEIADKFDIDINQLKIK